jgi:hypothetical protein
VEVLVGVVLDLVKARFVRKHNLALFGGRNVIKFQQNVLEWDKDGTESEKESEECRSR